MEINKSNVFELMNITGTKPSKDFGQNFLIDPIICERIVSTLDVKIDEKVIKDKIILFKENRL